MGIFMASMEAVNRSSGLMGDPIICMKAQKGPFELVSLFEALQETILQYEILF